MHAEAIQETTISVLRCLMIEVVGYAVLCSPCSSSPSIGEEADGTDAEEDDG